jgi:hypothetical protein
VAYQTLNTPTFTKNGITYISQYDSRNGEVQVIQANAPTGTKPIYVNGNFTAEAASIGLTDSNERQSIHNDLTASIRGAYTTAGGASKGLVLPVYAQQSNQGNAPGQSSSPPSSVPDPNNSSGNLLTAIVDTAKAIGNPIDSIKNISVNGDKFGVGNESKLFSGQMIYPVDMKTETQDHMIIEQVGYFPPNAESLFSGSKKIWTEGLTRGTDVNKEKIIGRVHLPMPNTVQDTNSVGWDADTMNNLSAGAAADVMGNMDKYAAAAGLGGAAGQLVGGNASGGSKLAIQAMMLLALAPSLANNPSLRALVGTDLASMILSMGGKGVDAETILARGGGIVPNNNMEFLFKSPTLRSFNNFSWRMTARSPEEAAVIRRIVRFFKQGMAPKKFTGKSGAPSYMLGTPNVFKLSYHNGKNGLIEGVNLFKTCALTNFSTNYTPDGFWAAYDKGQPLSVSISMAFNELEPIYDTDYQSDNIFDNRSDLTSVTDSMVGY